jgi:hypothetical protein
MWGSGDTTSGGARIGEQIGVCRVHDILELIFKIEPRQLKCEKPITWKEALDCGDWSSMIQKLTDQYLYDFDQKNFLAKLRFIEKNVGIVLDVPESVLENVAFAEQARHLFVHTGGKVTSTFVQRTNRTDFAMGDRVTATVEFCWHLSESLLQIVEQIAAKVVDKFSTRDQATAAGAAGGNGFCWGITMGVRMGYVVTDKSKLSHNCVSTHQVETQPGSEPGNDWRSS